jgi:Zn-dependent membrane protease YugP
VHDGTSLAALGVACHEVGHVYQHAQGYAPLKVRNILVPLSFGANIGFILILVGFFLSSMKLAIVGLALFSVIAIFQIVNLPVEFNASARAKAYLSNSGMVRPGPETAAVSSVLSAAAMTYVAATAQSVMQVLYWAYLIFGRRE